MSMRKPQSLLNEYKVNTVFLEKAAFSGNNFTSYVSLSWYFILLLVE